MPSGYTLGNRPSEKGEQMIRNLLWLLPFTLVACAPKNPPVVIPLAYNCPIIQLPIYPPVLLNKLNNKSKPNEVIQVWVATAESCLSYVKVAKQQIKRSQSKTNIIK